jgi:hypothetical protein
MFPTPYRPPNPFQPRSRPISPFDNAATTGLFSNPNGTYIANPFPTTAQNGQQGAYGAMLPQVQVGGGQTWIQKAASVAGSNFTPGQTWIQQAANLPTTTPTSQIGPAPTSQAAKLVNQGVPASVAGGMNPSAQNRGSSVIDNYNYIRTTGQINEGVIKLIVQQGANSAAYQALSPAQKEAVDRIAGGAGPGGGGGGTPGAGQFYGYVRNEETGRSERVIKDSSTSSFSKELRWDPDRRKYVEIGKLMSEGKLDKRGGWHKKKKGGGGSSGGGRGAAPPGKRAGWTGSYGVVNFNTGTG